MKFDYHSEKFGSNFNFSLTEDEIRNYLHKRGFTYDFVYGIFPPNVNEEYKILVSIGIINDAISSDSDVDLGIDYKKKYEKLVELLEPYKIDDMTPETTLKMILKYGKP